MKFEIICGPRGYADFDSEPVMVKDFACLDEAYEYATSLAGELHDNLGIGRTLDQVRCDLMNFYPMGVSMLEVVEEYEREVNETMFIAVKEA